LQGRFSITDNGLGYEQLGILCPNCSV